MIIRYQFTSKTTIGGGIFFLHRYLTFPDNQGRETVVDYDPYTKDSDNYK